ncbi:DUF7311 family protein [Haloplanus sp.]|uniref:DUF7311 family protein n=1 Tax=Haloplanus sp. TaxID=1961696 RepID=UPI00263A1466|nr:hypothetical protein [Haloplanus sp.]
MIRIVLAAVLTVALLAAATPAIDEGRAARTAIHLDGETDRLYRATRSLLAYEDPTRPSVTGPRRIIRVRLPTRSWTASEATLRIDGEADLLAYRVGDGRPRRTAFRDVDLRTPDGPIRLRTPGRHRLVLSLVRDNGTGVVVRRG